MSIYIKETSDDSSSSAAGGIGFLGLLTVLFIGLKLTNYITWSWWLVLLPMYGPVTLVLSIMLILAIIYKLVK